MERHFVQANSSNLPQIYALMIVLFFKDNVDFYAAELKNVKTAPFPKNPLLRDKWLRITDRSRWTPAKNSCICSKHFESKYFIQRKHRRVLMRGSIPTIFVPVQLKNRRQCSYVNRDISPPPGPPGPILSLREKKLINRCSNLKKKVLQKNKLLRNLKAKSKKISIQLLNLQALVKDLYKRLEHKHHKNEILPDPDLIKVEMT